VTKAWVPWVLLAVGIVVGGVLVGVLPSLVPDDYVPAVRGILTGLLVASSMFSASLIRGRQKRRRGEKTYDQDKGL
jgi:hypothetical protein